MTEVTLLVILVHSVFVKAVYATVVEEALYSLLMKNYLKEVRPTQHHWIRTNVTFGFLLQSIVDLDEKNSILSTRAWLNINWMDARLKWNRTEQQNIKLLTFPHSRIWKPDIILTNNADQHYEGQVMSTDVFVTDKGFILKLRDTFNPVSGHDGSKGNVTWLASAIFKSACRIRVKYFPFDDQVCMMNFTSWSHNGDEIDMLLITEKGDISSYVRSSEFDLESMHILPGAIFASMAFTGFLIPPDSGEKITMCITTMLSMGVYMKTVTEKIPASEELPLLGMYYGVLLCVVCIITVCNIWTLNLFMSGSRARDKEIPKWVRTFILGYLARMLKMKIPVELQMNQKKSRNPSPKLLELSSCSTTVTAAASPVRGINEIFTKAHSLESSHRSKPHSMKMNAAGGKLDKQFADMYNEIQIVFQSVLDRVSGTLARSQHRELLDDRKCCQIREWKGSFINHVTKFGGIISEAVSID